MRMKQHHLVAREMDEEGALLSWGAQLHGVLVQDMG